MHGTNTPGVRYNTSHAERLRRLASLQATDPGTFVLAVHSFVEGVIRQQPPRRTRAGGPGRAFSRPSARSNAITRAMDHCAVFVKEGLTTKAVTDLFAARARD